MKVHFIAIGGAAMHSLALALHSGGCRVSGSDDRIADPSRSRLQARGLLPPEEGWFPDRVTPDLDAVILGMHAREDNPELIRARDLGLRIYSFPEFLYEQTRNKRRVVVGGSHGKTTITSMILHVLRSAGRQFDYMVGAQLEGFDNTVRVSESTDLAVFEGDEYLASALDPRPKFHIYRPHMGVISGIAWDHVNVFPTYEGYLEQFSKFASCIEEGGCLVFNRDDEAACQLAESAPSGLRKIGYERHPGILRDGVCHLVTPAGPLPIHVFGRHNLENLAAAQTVCRELGLGEEEFYRGIAGFRGAARRLETLAESPVCRVFRDFAHAPSKVRATVRAVRELYPGRRLIACLELHTFSSVDPGFLPQYEGTLDRADQAVVYYDPGVSRQKNTVPLSPACIRRAFARPGLRVIRDAGEFVRFLKSLDLTDASLLLMSSGSFSGLDLVRLSKELVGKSVRDAG